MICRLISALLLVTFAGLNQPGLAAAERGAGKNSGTLAHPKNLADAQIERAFKNKLAKSKMRDEHFTISVVKGVATIEGATNVMQHKGAITRMAKSSGAASVHNNIRISDTAKKKAAASLAKGRSKPAAQPTAGAISRIAAPGPGGNATAASIIPRATVLPPVSR